MRYLILLLTALSAVVWADDTADSAQSRLTYINNNTIYIDQVGNSNTNVIQQNSSQASIAGVGANSLPIQGDGNTVTLKQGDPGGSGQHLIEGEIYGSYNTVNATQSDIGGMYGHSLYENITGSNNNVTTQQYGPNSTIINLTSVGSNGTINIKTGK